MKNAILIFSALFCCYSCEVNTSKKQEQKILQPAVTPNFDKKLIDSLIDSAILQGNEMAYNKVASYFLIEDRGEDFLYVALSVANKYNNREAYFHVYIILNSSRTGETLEKLDTKTKDFALYYLLKSYEMGFESAKYKVHEIFGKDKEIPKFSYYLNEFAKSK